MKFGKSYQSILLSGFILVLLFGSFSINSNTTQDMQCWGTLRDSYTYIYDVEHYDYEKEEPLTETKKEIKMWDVESENNNITFRTDQWEVFLGLVDCESEECYDEYRDAWEYSATTDSFKVTYRYNIEDNELQFVDPVQSESVSLGPGMPIPCDPVDISYYLFGWFKGLGFTFLPVDHPNFSFKANFEEYVLYYEDFEINFADIFKFQRKTFEGYHYEFSYNYEWEMHTGAYYEELETKFSYNKQGELYDYYSQYKFYEKNDDKLELKIKTILEYFIDTYDESLAVTNSWAFAIGGILVVTVIIFGWRRRK